MREGKRACTCSYFVVCVRAFYSAHLRPHLRLRLQAIARGVARKEIWVTTKLHERFYDRCKTRETE